MTQDTPARYTSYLKWLHWLTALWIFVAYALVLYLEYVLHGEGPLRSPLIRLHKAVGASVLIFVVLRLWWRAMNPVPPLPKSMPKWQVRVSHLTHLGLYALLIAMPLSGYLGNGSGVSFGIFSIPSFDKTMLGQWVLGLLDIDFETFEAPFDFFHYRIAGPFLFWMLVAAHAGAALYHHYIEKDDVLRRMLPQRRG